MKNILSKKCRFLTLALTLISLPANAARVTEYPNSTLSIPVTKDLTQEFALVEKAVPHEDSNESGDEKSKVRYHWWRDALNLRFAGNQLLLSTRIHYSAEGQAKIPPFGPWVSGSCNDRAIDLTFQSTVQVLPNWRLQTHTVLTQLNAANRCQVTFLNIDITQRILNKVQKLLEGTAANVDERLALLHFQNQVNDGWSALQQIIKLDDGIWLKINPANVSLGQVRGSGRTLQATVGIEARPELFFNEAPEFTPSPLPPLSATPPDHGFHIYADTFLAYEVMAQLLELKTLDHSFQGPAANLLLKIQAVRIFATEQGQLSVNVSVTGSATGTLTLSGGLQVSQNTVTAADLTLDATSRQWLATQAPWFNPQEFTAALRDAATWPMTTLTEELRVRIAEKLNLEIAPGFQLSGTITKTEVVDSEARPKAWLVRIRADGTAALGIQPQRYQ